MLAPLTLWFCIFPSAFTSWHPGHLFGRVTLREEVMMRALSFQTKTGGSSGHLDWHGFFFLLFLHPASVELKNTELYEDSMQLAFSKEKFGLSSLFRIRLRGCKESHSFC